MTIHDQHVHSYLSFDCEELPENYLSAETKELVLTDHFDLNNPVTDFKDDVPDFEQLLVMKRELAEKNGVTLRLGVEVGYVPDLQEVIKEKIKAYPFDVILLSCHHNNQNDYMDEEIKDASTDPVEQYFDQLYQAIVNIPEAHILAHFDYGTRIHQFNVEKLKKYKQQLIKILQAIIDNKMALELNSKSMYRYGNYDLYEYIIPLYQSLGGSQFTLGSDAHKAEELEMDFDQSKQLLRENGVHEVVIYREGQAEFVRI